MGLCTFKEGVGRRHPQFLRVVDVAMAFLWVFPVNVVYWRGTWDLLDVYVIPGDIVTGSWISALVGIVLCSIGNCLQPVLAKYFPPSNRLQFVAVRCLFIYMFALGSLAHWRGVWTLLDHYAGVEFQGNVIRLVLAMVLCWVLRVSMTNVDAPVVIAYDNREDFFSSRGRLQIEPTQPLKYCLDRILSQMVVVNLVVTVWCCLWNLNDICILPDDWTLSNIVSMCAGLGLCLTVIILEEPIAATSAKLDNRCIIWKLLVEDLYVFVAIIGVVSSWRGAWNLLMTYILPDPTIGGWVCHWVGFIAGVCTCTGSGLYECNVYVDGDSQDGDGVRWPIKYLQIMLQPKPQHATDLKVPGLKDDNEAVAVGEILLPVGAVFADVAL